MTHIHIFSHFILSLTHCPFLPILIVFFLFLAIHGRWYFFDKLGATLTNATIIHRVNSEFNLSKKNHCPSGRALKKFMSKKI